MTSTITSVFLPLALAIVMFGLGLSLTLDDFRRVATSPRATLVALGCQLLLLPALCLLLIETVGLPGHGPSGPMLAAGMMLLAATPGGTTASLFSHLFRGDVALNISLIAVNSVLSVVTLPLITNFAFARYLPEGGQSVGLHFGETLEVFAIVLVPVLIGMAVRARRGDFALRMDRPVRIASVALLVLVIIGAVISERENIGGYLGEVGLICVGFCLINLTIGYFVPRLFGVRAPQAIASSMEIGVHNGTLAMTIALSVLGNTTLAIPAAVYSLLKFAIVPAFGWVISRSYAARPLTEASRS